MAHTASRLGAGPISAALALLLALLPTLPTAASAQIRRASSSSDGPAVTLRPRVGMVDGSGTVGVFGLGLGLSLADGVTLLGSAQRVGTATTCEDASPSTCGRDGWAAMGSLRLGLTAGIIRPFVEGGIGGYRFRGEARDGDWTRVLGTRYGATLRTEGGTEWGAAWETLRLDGYERDGISFPSLRVEAIHIEVGLPLG